MKQALLTILVIAALNAHAQSEKKGGYFSIRGGTSFKGNNIKGTASASVGFSENNRFGIGGGIGYINFERPYIPVTVDVSFFGTPGKVSPVVIGQAGFGIYKYSTPYATSRGSFTGSISAGIGLPLKRNNRIILTGGYYYYSFITTTKGNAGPNSEKIYSSENRYAVTAGFKI